MLLSVAAPFVQDRRHPQWLDVIRIVLGVLLFVKGLSFIIDRERVMQLVNEFHFEFIPLLVLHVVIIFQMAHAVLISIGLVTRIAIAMQLPIVLAAIVLLATRPEFSVFGSDLGFAVLVVALLLFFLAFGPGPLSIDWRLRKSA